MFVSSIDDPTINPEFNPYKEFENNDNIIGCFTRRGGHCGHFTGGIIPRQWFPSPMLEFLDYLESRSREDSKQLVHGPKKSKVILNHHLD